MHYQAYLLEGIVRWNEDRAVAAVEDIGAPRSHTYSSALRHEVNRLNELQYGKDLVSYQDPGKYTGQKVIYNLLFIRLKYVNRYFII